MTAIREKNYKVMRVLHEFGVRSDDGAVDPSQSPVQYALQYNDPNLLDELLNWQDIYIDFSAVDHQNKNLFHMIAKNQDLGAFEAVIKYAKTAEQKAEVRDQLNKSHDPA